MNKVYLVYFSATNTTKKVVRKIAEGTGIKDIQEVDVTLPSNRDGSNLYITDDALVIFGAPVYSGRVEKHAAEYFKQFKGKGQPAVCVAVYGNRDFDDAVVEMMDIATSCDFIPIASAGFIGEHSFATPEFDIANGRPDENDNKIAVDFGKEIIEKVKANDQSIPTPRGNRPYKERPEGSSNRFSAKTEACLGCLACQAVCPAGAIDDNADCDENKCISCFACIRICPNRSRIFEGPIKGAREKLSQIPRHEPELFI